MLCKNPRLTPNSFIEERRLPDIFRLYLHFSFRSKQTITHLSVLPISKGSLRSILSSLLFLYQPALSFYAADVPKGTCWRKTGAGQTHQRRNPASLDQAGVRLPIQVIRDLFEGLVNQNEKGELTPGVATRWQSNDNRIWTFTLRDDAKWSDGTPVTAQDFVYSWQRLVDPKTTSPFALVCCSGH